MGGRVTGCVNDRPGSIADAELITVMKSSTRGDDPRDDCRPVDEAGQVLEILTPYSMLFQESTDLAARCLGVAIEVQLLAAARVNPHVAAGGLDQGAGQPNVVGVGMSNDDTSNVSYLQVHRAKRCLEFIQYMIVVNGGIPGATVNECHRVIAGKSVCIHSV
jgi:hypothetical protein